MADERTVSTTDVVSYLDNGDPNYIFEIVDKTARANITSINTTLGKKRSIFYCDYFKFNSTDTTKTKQRYQFVGPYHKMTNGAKTFTAANLIAGDVCFSTEVRAYDGTTVIKRGLFALEYNYKSSSKYYSPAAYTYGAVDFDFTDRLPVVTSSNYESVLAVNSSGEWEVNSDFNTRLYDVENVAGTAANDVLDLQDRIGYAEDNISTLQTDVSSAQGDITTLQDESESHGSAITELDNLTTYMNNVGSSDYGKVLTWTNNAVWEAADVPKELPAVTSSDNGKVLKVASGAWTKAAETKELPSVTTSDNNKVLKVVSGAWTKAAAPTELPAVTSSDNGKVLGVANGAWAKTDIPTELPTVDDSDNQKILTVVSGDWIASYPEPQLPTVSSADNGKVLGVSSGDWTTINIPTELPAVTTSDNNKVLKVVSGAWAKAAETKELPAVTTSDNNKVLKVVSGAWAKAAETKELPTVTTSDAGNVLTVNSSGKWAKAAPPTELPAVTSSDNGKVLTVNSSGAWGAATAPTTPAQKLHYCGGFDKVSGVVSAIDSYESVSNLAVDDLMYSYQFYDDTLNTNIPQKGFWISRITAISESSITVDPIPFYSDTNTYSIERSLATVRQGIIKTSKVGAKALTSGLATDSIKIYSDDTGASGLDDFYYKWRGTYVNKTKTLNGIVIADGWVSYTTDIDTTTWEDVYTFTEHTGLYIGKVTTVELVNNVVCLTVTPLYTKEDPKNSDETLYAHVAPSPSVVFSKTNAGLLEDFITAIKNNWANFDWTNRHRAIIVGSNSMGGKHYGNAINVCWQFNSSTKPNELNVLEFDFMSEGTILHFKYNNSTYTVKEIVGTTTGVTYTDVSSETGYSLKMTEFWLYQ